MPTYEYQCRQCRKRSEVRQEITAKALTKCAKCGGRLQRLIGSGSGFLFKGSGFYITDYRSAGYQAKAKAEQSSAGGPAKSGSVGGSSSKASGSSGASGSPKKD